MKMYKKIQMKTTNWRDDETDYGSLQIFDVNITLQCIICIMSCIWHILTRHDPSPKPNRVFPVGEIQDNVVLCATCVKGQT